MLLHAFNNERTIDPTFTLCWRIFDGQDMEVTEIVEEFIQQKQAKRWW